MARSGIQKNSFFIKFWQLSGAHADQGYAVFPVRMETGIGKTLSFILSEEPTVPENNVIYFVPGALSVEAVPFLRRLLTLLSAAGVKQKCHKCRCSWASAVVRQQSIFEFIFADHEFGKFHMQFILWSENLHILRYCGREVFHSP
ncbi:unnamed protein product [Chrysodeixis includens]|uniref:Uncharacterized protein n=1 Tax=Chrysodeixis includens TaxID=689277 RepID=A0A9N8PWI6_CHRIL|nr:unnamed protein product [Chrysodeixis includens]